MRKRHHHLPPFNGDGLLIVDKPQTWTSFDVVNMLRGTFNIAKIGHCGTLDPNATGLLVLVIGSYTKRAQEYAGDSKTYCAEIILGQTTDSYDVEGKVTSQSPYTHLTHADIVAAVETFKGDILQCPPMMSAIKKDGKKLYELGRQGVEIEREPRPVTLYELDIESIELPRIHLRCHCSKGTYIRSLAHDIGQNLGCGAYLNNLRRIQSGKWTLQDHTPTPDDLRSCSQDELKQRMFTDDVLYS